MTSPHSRENWTQKFRFCSSFISFIKHNPKSVYGVYKRSTYQMNALLSEIFRILVRAACELRLTSYGPKHASRWNSTPATALKKITTPSLMCAQVLQRGLPHWRVPWKFRSGGFSVALTKRYLLSFFECLYATRGGFGITCFILSETCRMGRWRRRIWCNLGTPGWYVTTSGTLLSWLFSHSFYTIIYIYCLRPLLWTVFFEHVMSCLINISFLIDHR